MVLPAILLAGCGGAVSQPEATTTSAVAMTEADDPGVSYAIPKVIDQKVTPFGDNGCGGAAALMGLQAAGYLKDADTDTEYDEFWKSVPTDPDATKGYNGNGIWNPAYADWIATFAEAERIQDFTAEDIMSYLKKGYVVIPLVSLGETGDTTHWFTVTGYKVKDGLLLFDVADPWAGVMHEYTAGRLDKRIQEGAKRKGDFGAGYEKDGLIIKIKR